MQDRVKELIALAAKTHERTRRIERTSITFDIPRAVRNDLKMVAQHRGLTMTQWLCYKVELERLSLVEEYGPDVREQLQAAEEARVGCTLEEALAERERRTQLAEQPEH